MKRIWITGCARSGTTLLRRLFYAFDDVYIIDHEVSAKGISLSKCPIETEFFVGKRNKWSVFSYDLAPKIVSKQLKLLRQNDVFVINMLRDGRDTIESRQNADAHRWLASFKGYLNNQESVDLPVYYESLVTDPDTIQQLIIGRLSMAASFLFSQYPDFVPGHALTEGSRYEPRAIDDSKVNKQYNWRGLVRASLQKEFKAACMQYQEMLNECNNS